MKLLQEETGWGLVQLSNLLILIMVSSGVFGFVYELLFYKIDTGRWTKRGSTFGPWIPIYVFGGAAYTLLVYPLKDHPLLVFLLSVIVSGIMEYVTGWVLYEVFHIRLWDYNTEIWNFGNIKGYVCLRSVLVFGLAGLMLIYLMIPVIILMMGLSDEEILTIICRALALAFIVDCLVYKVLEIRGKIKHEKAKD